MDSTIDPRIDAYNNIFLGFNSNGGGVYASMSLQNLSTPLAIIYFLHPSALEQRRDLGIFLPKG